MTQQLCRIASDRSVNDSIVELRLVDDSLCICPFAFVSVYAATTPTTGGSDDATLDQAKGLLTLSCGTVKECILGGLGVVNHSRKKRG
jgi:hypothetical protein